MGGRAGLVCLLLAGLAVAGVGCTAKPCAGVGFDGTVHVDLAALHAAHPGVLTVRVCIDGVCDSAEVQPDVDGVDPTPKPTAEVRDIEVEVTDSTGAQIFDGQLRSRPTKVTFDRGKCDEQVVFDDSVVAGADGTLTSVAVTPTEISVPSGPESTA